mgnify:CR=1 FL=1
MSSEVNMVWGSDSISAQIPAEDVVAAASAQFDELTGNHPTSNAELLEFFTEGEDEQVMEKEL